MLENGSKKSINTSRAAYYSIKLVVIRRLFQDRCLLIHLFSLDSEMVQLLTMAERALGRLDGASGILPNVDLFVAMYVSKEAVLSSQIEGTQASLIDVLAFEADASVPENPQDIEAGSALIKCVEYLFQRPNTLPPPN